MHHTANPPFLARLVVMGNVVLALMYRELRTRFGQYHLGYFWALAEPLTLVIVLSVIFGVRSITAPGGVDFPVFLATGLIPWLVFRSMVARAMTAIEGNRALFSYRQVKPFDTIAARAALEFVLYVLVFLVFIAGAGWLGFDVAVADPLGVLIVFTALALLGLGVGALGCVLAALLPDIAQIIPIILRPLWFVSGIFFSLERIPAEFHGYLLWNPLLHAMEIMRESYFASITASQGDPLYLAAWVAGSLFLGLVTFHVFRYRLIST